jgi:hypothetical protein
VALVSDGQSNFEIVVVSMVASRESLSGSFGSSVRYQTAFCSKRFLPSLQELSSHQRLLPLLKQRALCPQQLISEVSTQKENQSSLFEDEINKLG